mmetsp:Transcript_13861/g.32703  ORF Transcript_13861/g.32703 Transcript_13861/m.32703 type:complete len:102 (+) Transcript_13861:73-378(+)
MGNLPKVISHQRDFKTNTDSKASEPEALHRAAWLHSQGVTRWDSEMPPIMPVAPQQLLRSSSTGPPLRDSALPQGSAVNAGPPQLLPVFMRRLRSSTSCAN